jgi:hypothetical protein
LGDFLSLLYQDSSSKAWILIKFFIHQMNPKPDWNTNITFMPDLERSPTILISLVPQLFCRMKTIACPTWLPEFGKPTDIRSWKDSYSASELVSLVHGRPEGLKF